MDPSVVGYELITHWRAPSKVMSSVVIASAIIKLNAHRDSGRIINGGAAILDRKLDHSLL